MYKLQKQCHIRIMTRDTCDDFHVFLHIKQLKKSQQNSENKYLGLPGSDVMIYISFMFLKKEKSLWNLTTESFRIWKTINGINGNKCLVGLVL